MKVGSLAERYVIGWLETPVGKVPRISTGLTSFDKAGEVMVRLGIRRTRYMVEPGLYAVGTPNADSPILVTANYKLSFDSLRRELGGLDAWIMVLDTKGINVWCAAGKGTFGTEEIIKRIELTQLAKIVNTRRLILPQLAGPGVAAHQVLARSGFSVVYGPIRAADLPTFLKAGMKASPEMRRVRFTLRDRLVLTPMEFVGGARYLLLALGLLLALSGINPAGYSLGSIKSSGFHSAGFVLVAYLCGTIAGPLLLPYLPGRSFSTKGAFAGLIIFAALSLTRLTGNSAETIAWLFLFTTIASFATMNFTGASTYTSLSGVKKEMRFAVPLQVTSAVFGLFMWIVARVV